MNLGVLTTHEDRIALGEKLPPRGPEAQSADDDSSLKRNLKTSATFHVAVLLVVLIKSIVLPGTPKTYQPALRVDIVGLPDLLKQDMQNLRPAKPETTTAEPALPRKAIEKEEADPDEMVLKREAKSVAEKNRKLLKEFEEKTRNEEERRKKMDAALRRVKSLAKLNDIKDTPEGETSPTQIKGNQISRGASVSGDARQSDHASYYDQVRARLQENWELPVWLSRQNLAARIEVFVDRKGMVRSYRFTKASGNPQFDEAIKRTLTASQPFPAPPAEEADSLLVHGISVGFPL